MELPLIIWSHFVWGLLITLAGVATYKKARQTDIEMLNDFTKFFLILGIPFFTVMATLWAVGYRTGNSTILSLGYVLPHIFALTALGYLWKVQSSIQFPQYKKVFWAFAAYGAALVMLGIWEMPPVLVQNGTLLFGPGSMFAMMLQIGMTVGLLAITAMSFYSAYITSGTSRTKMALIGFGTFLLIVGAIGHNAGTETAMIIGEIANLIWVGSFLTVVYLDKIRSKLGGVIW